MSTHDAPATNSSRLPRRQATSSKDARAHSRHGLNAVKARVALRGFTAIDMRSGAARAMLAFRDELVIALGGDTEVSPQRRKLIDLASRASLYLDHLDAWLAAQETLINRRSRSVLPVLLQRQTLADHLARVLDKLGLDRHPQRVRTLEGYLVQKYGTKNNKGPGPAGTEPSS